MDRNDYYWNREKLYEEVWEQPLLKVAARYGVSAVALGKTCRKLQVPVPGRGYWAKKQFGKPVKRPPLPGAKDLPVVQRMKRVDSPVPATPPDPVATPAPSDPELARIAEVESGTIVINPTAKQHRLIGATLRNLRHASTDGRGILQRPYDRPSLDVRVSQGALERALSLMNGMVLALEAEGCPVVEEPSKHEVGARVHGHLVPFAIVEKTRVIGRREVKEYSWTRTVIDYEPTGQLEFRVGDHRYGPQTGLRDSKKRRLEDLLARCVGSVMREGRSLRIQAEEHEKWELERRKKQAEMIELAEQIRQEEEKVSDLETWVAMWARAQQMREFITALEKAWAGEGHDLSPGAPKGQRIIWMKQQADRLDPMLTNPPSILDRKGELNRW